MVGLRNPPSKMHPKFSFWSNLPSNTCSTKRYLDLFKLNFLGIYHGKSPVFTTHLVNICFFPTTQEANESKTFISWSQIADSVCFFHVSFPVPLSVRTSSPSEKVGDAREFLAMEWSARILMLTGGN